MNAGVRYHSFKFRMAVLLIRILGLFLLAAIACLSVSNASEMRLNNDRHNFDANTIVLPMSMKDALQTQIFRQLLSNSEQKLKWPDFPRTWLQRDRASHVTTNTSVGFAAPAVGGRASIEYKFLLKTTLTIIATARKPDDRGPNNHGEPTQLDVFGSDAVNLDDFEILRTDPETLLTYANVRENRPMVAFCSYEASLTPKTAATLGIDFFNNGGKVTTGFIESMSESAFSSFIQVSPKVPIRTYLNDFCNKVFREGVERHLLADFSKMVVEHMAYSSGKSKCFPDSVSLKSIQNGDSGCMKWHKEFGSAIQKMTVPRCELNTAGYYACWLKAKPRINCPMYYDKDRKEFVDDYADRRVIKATKGLFAFPCDKEQGFRCTMDSEPWMLWGIPFAEGTATCKSSAPRKKIS